MQFVELEYISSLDTAVYFNIEDAFLSSKNLKALTTPGQDFSDSFYDMILSSFGHSTQLPR